MTESQCISRRRKRGYDRLSELPSSIIHTILSSLPTEDAVRTSILSREWRYTWTGLPKLKFITYGKGTKDKRIASEERRKEFISYALSVHKGSLHTFILGGDFEQPCPNLDEWLIRLSTKDIKELALTAEHRSWPRVHSSIYSCNMLTCLLLSTCEMRPPPSTFKGFSFLRKLTLSLVKISNATIERLVSNSPLLESLHLFQFKRDKKNSMIRVHAPKLKSLNLHGYWTEMSMNAPLLADISVSPFPVYELQTGSFCNYTNFLGGCTNLEKLLGYSQFTQVMSIGMESWSPNALVFHRLTTILLGKVDFQDVNQQRFLARLLVGAPNLQSLTIIATSPGTQDVHFSGFESNFRMEKLRIVRMDGVRGLLPEIKLIELLLERSPLLETMTVRLCTKGFKDKILGCTRASQNAKISVSAIEIWL